MDSENRKSSDIELEKIRIEIQHLRSTRYIPWITMLLTIAATLLGVWQFSRQMEIQLRRDAEERSQDFRKAFSDARKTIYINTAQIIGTIAALPPNDPARKQAEKSFWQLYRGEMIVVEDKEVKEAMIQFGNCLDGINEACRDEAQKQSQLQNLSIRVATALRLSMGKVPETKLEDLYKEEKSPLSPP